MKKTLKIIAVLFLFFNGISAIFGGGIFILDPTGQTMQMPIELMKIKLFSNFLIPGIILFTVNGLFNILAAVITILNRKGYELLIISAGIMLWIWLTVQIIVIKSFYPPLHLTYYVVGLIMIICGFLLRKYK
jgi:hypothetical protein